LNGKQCVVRKCRRTGVSVGGGGNQSKSKEKEGSKKRATFLPSIPKKEESGRAERIAMPILPAAHSGKMEEETRVLRQD